MNKISIGFVAALALALSACGGSDNKSANDPAQAVNDGRPADCGQAWNSHVAANPQGRVEEFETDTRTVSNGIEVNRSTTRETTRVIESNNEQVTVETQTRGAPSRATLTRAQFDGVCKQGVEVPAQVGGSQFEVLERGMKTVTVPAGTFNCQYVKGRVSMPGRTMNLEIWSEGSNRGAMIKMITTMDMSASGTSMQSVTTKQLVRRG